MQVIWKILVPMIHWSETACSEALSSQKLSWTRGSYSHRLLSDPIRSSSQDLLISNQRSRRKNRVVFVHRGHQLCPSEFVEDRCIRICTSSKRYAKVAFERQCFRMFVNVWSSCETLHPHNPERCFVLAYFQPASSQSGCLDWFAPGARSKTCASLAAPTFSQFGGRVSNLLALRQVGCFFVSQRMILLRCLNAKSYGWSHLLHCKLFQTNLYRQHCRMRCSTSSFPYWPSSDSVQN